MFYTLCLYTILPLPFSLSIYYLLFQYTALPFFILPSLSMYLPLFLVLPSLSLYYPLFQCIINSFFIPPSFSIYYPLFLYTTLSFNVVPSLSLYYPLSLSLSDSLYNILIKCTIFSVFYYCQFQWTTFTSFVLHNLSVFQCTTLSFFLLVLQLLQLLSPSLSLNILPSFSL